MSQSRCRWRSLDRDPAERKLALEPLESRRLLAIDFDLLKTSTRRKTPAAQRPLLPRLRIRGDIC